MQHSLVFYILMLLGFFNGLVVSLFIFIKIKSDTFLKLMALGVFLFSLTILREFLYVFEDDIELDFFIQQFFCFKLLTVAIVIIAYDKVSSSEKKDKTLLLLPGLLEFLLLSAISLGWVGWGDTLSDTMFIAVDCISFFWILHEHNKRKDKQIKQRQKLRFLSLFVLGFMLIFLTRAIQLFAILFESNGLYEFHFLFRIMAIGIIIYMISIYLIIFYSRHGNRKVGNVSSIKPQSKRLLEKLKEDQKYLDQNITLERLSYYYGLDSKTLSATIREHENRSFNDYINSLRLKHFMSLLEKSEHEKYTLMALAEKSGFNSKATFNRVFKNKFGVSPSLYIAENH